MEAYEYVLQELLKLPGAKTTSNPNQIRIMCPKCEKFHKEPKLYVGLMKNSKLLGYDCKYCLYSSVVNKTFLDQFGIECPEYIKDFKERKKTIKTINPVTDLVKLNLKIPNYINDCDKKKVDYIEHRLQRKITIKDIQTYKIVLNFKDFFKYNNFDYLQFAEDNVERDNIERNAIEYSEHFVGMLSVDNNKINLRNIDSKLINKRYMVHVIDKTLGNPYMYMPDIPIDILSPQPVINMAEGNYDIIGARELYFDKENYNNLFVAIGTKKAYRRVLDQILKMTCFLDADINIFADNDPDSSLDFYKQIFKEYRSIFPNINVYYNEKGKDFGDLSKPILARRCEI